MGTAPSKENNNNNSSNQTIRSSSIKRSSSRVRNSNRNNNSNTMKKRISPSSNRSRRKGGGGGNSTMSMGTGSRIDAADKAAMHNDVDTASTQASGLSVSVNDSKKNRHGTSNGMSSARGTPKSHISDGGRGGQQSSMIHDETVKVNLAMADLMAYLQVVANNSSNLPLTRRDDPELGKTVSTLTSEEYARKSAAFLPSDVRIISGSFTKYGSVWDLPASEEFDPADSTQEPGISHGGSCCNALLKVLYDTEAEGSQGTPRVDYTNANNLFEEEDDMFSMSMSEGPSVTFDSLILGDAGTTATITWADLLRKMKVEMRTAGYAQVPAITSSRKFDLKTPFSLVPPNFDPTKNKKRSLLIGCNYSNIPEVSIKACHDDIRSIKDFIVNVHGFPEAKGLMTILLDDDNHKHPTHTNITEAFKNLSEHSQPGDAVFVQFSGHGCRTLDSSIDSDVETYDEAIIPSDFRNSGIIRDTLIFKTLLAPMRYGVTVTSLFDCCDTGIMVDLPYSWTAKSDRVENDPKMSLNEQFSFVRFLKVIKTLYESSTFTQLGKTVRSVLHEKIPNDRRYGDDHSIMDESTVGGSLMTVESTEPNQTTKKASLTLMTVLNACSSPPPTSPDRRLKSKNTENSGGTKSTVAEGPSLFQQVLLCGLSHPADYEDDYTYLRAHTEDASEGPSFHTDDEYDGYARGGGRKNASTRSGQSNART